MLRVEGLKAGYGDLEILHGIDLEVGAGEVVAIIGANGAGKTTTLKTISGVVGAWEGSIVFDGASIQDWSPPRIVEGGLVQVPEGRKLFPALTVEQNLILGSYRRARAEAGSTMDEVLDLFPILAERSGQLAGTLSGGEQQMLAIGRAMMARPRLIMLDEPSLGLAPQLVTAIFDVIRQISSAGVTVMLVEQNAVRALKLSDRAYVLENGNVVLAGTGEEMLGNDRVRSAYLGL